MHASVLVKSAFVPNTIGRRLSGNSYIFKNLIQTILALQLSGKS